MSPEPRTSHSPATTGDDDHHRHRAIAVHAMRDAHRLAETFERAAARVRDQRARTTGAPVTDPEAVHDLRVAARRLGSALRVWRPVLHKSPRRDVARALRELRRAFGPVREIEVHLTQVDARSTVSGAPPAALAALAALDRKLHTRYSRARTSALATLESRRARNVARDIGRAFSGMRHRLADPRERAKVVARMKAARTDAQQAIRAGCRAGIATDDETFHRARIAIKKWRYAIERNVQANESALVPLERLREMQSALGRAHDAITLDAEITRFAARSRARKVSLAPISVMLREEAQRHVARFLKRARTLDVMDARQKRPAGAR